MPNREPPYHIIPDNDRNCWTRVPNPKYKGGDLTFAALREANLKRCEAPRPQGFNHPLFDWTPLQWAGAMCGEAGEAANKAKKIDRQALQGENIARELNSGGTLANAMETGEEIGDLLIYADLLAARLGLTTEECVRMAFNSKSKEIGSDIFI